MKKTTIYTIIAFAIMLLFAVIPPVAPLTDVGMMALGVFIGTVILISLVDTTWPAILCIPLFALTGVTPMNDLVKGSLGSWVTMFVLMSFILTYALNETGFTNRLTMWFMSRKFVNRSPWIFTVSLITLGLLVGLVLDPVPVTAFFMNFSNKVFQELGYKKEDKYPHIVTMALAFSINIAGGMTPISHPLAILGMNIYKKATGNELSLLQYILYAFPTGLIIFICLLIMLRLFAKPDMSKFKDFDINKILTEVKPMTNRERITVATFFIVVILWLLPGVLGMIMPGTIVQKTLQTLGPVFPAISAVAILAILRADNAPVLDLKKALKEGFSWGVIFLVAAAVLLGDVITQKNVGMTEFVQQNIMPVTNNLSPIMIVLFLVFLTSLLTNFTSNVTTITLMTNVAMLLTVGATNGVSPVGIALSTTITGALAYMVPASFASIAVLYGNEYSHGPTTFKYGFFTVLITTMIVTFVGYPLAMMIAH